MGDHLTLLITPGPLPSMPPLPPTPPPTATINTIWFIMVGTTSKPQYPHRGQLVKPGEELIQGHDQFLRSALGGQAGEALNVRKQDAVENSGREMGLVALKDSWVPCSPPGSIPSPALPDIVMLLDVDLMEHHVFFFCVDVFFHFHGNMLGQHR